MNRLFEWFILIVLINWISACTPPIRYTTLEKGPVPFEPAIRSLTNHLLAPIQADRGVVLDLLSETKIVLDPFVDATSGEVVNASRRIEEIILEEAQKNFATFSLRRLQKDSLKEANYVMSGVISFDNYQTLGTTQKEEKYYRVAASIFNRQTGKIVANSNLWVSGKELDYTPVPVYKDSPVYYLKDKRVEGLVTTTKTPVGQPANKSYYDNLDTNALLVQADTAYEVKDYTKASVLYDLVAKREDGQTMKTFAGAYESYLKLGQTKLAKQRFSKLLKQSVKENNKLNIKLLFSVNKMEFIEDEELRKQYTHWLQEIGDFLQVNNYCFHIVGHSSHTGAADYNKQLSLERAKTVQKLMLVNFSKLLQRSKAIGKGFEENLVGSGTDDLRDTIDRRVEFVIVDCSKL